MELDIKIKKILFHPEDLEIQARFRNPIKGRSNTLDTTYCLRFNPTPNWSSYELLRKIGVRMSDRKGKERKVFGTVIRDELLKITEQDFQRRVYYLWNAPKYKERIGARGIFRLFHTARDGAEETSISFRMAFGQALFQKEGGKKSDKSWYWLGDYRHTQIKFFTDFEYKYIQQSLISQFSPEHYRVVGLSLGRLADSSGNEEYLIRACQYFEIAVKHKKGFSEAYSDWAAALFLLGQIRSSERLYRESLKKSSLAIKYNRKLPLAYFNRGAALYALAEIKTNYKLYHKAIENFRQTVGLMENHSGAYCYWALILQKMADTTGDLRLLEEAQEKYVLAIKCNPVEHKAYMNLGNVLSSLGERTGEEKYFRDAVENFQLAEKYDETSPIVHVNWAKCLLMHYRAFHSANSLEESVKHLFQAFVLSILRKEWDLAIHYGATLLDYPLEQPSNETFVKTQVFLEAVKSVQFGGLLSEDAKLKLTKLTGQSTEADIVIQAMIERRPLVKADSDRSGDPAIRAAMLLGKELLKNKRRIQQRTFFRCQDL